MSTTDTRAAFGAWWLQTHTFDGPATIEDVARRAFDAGHQAATEAAKATGTAGELSESQKIAMQYGQQLNDAEATAFVSGIELGKELAARQPAPALPVKTWQERLKEGGWEDYTAMLAEIAELRAALAATAAPVLSDEQILANETLKYYFGLNGGKGPVSDKGHNIIQAVLTVATRSQP